MSTMSPEGRRELVAAVIERYQRSTLAERGRILDEFVALTGYHRKHAIRVLNGTRIPGMWNTDFGEVERSSERSDVERSVPPIRFAMVT